MKRVLLALLVAGVLFAAVYASAAHVDVLGGVIQEGIDTDLTCTDAIQVAGWGLETDDDAVYFVRFEPLPAECAKVDVFVEVLGPGGALLAEGDTDGDPNAPKTGDYWKVYFPAVNPESVGRLHVYIEGADNP
jgi:hypothetical protein